MKAAYAILSTLLFFSCFASSMEFGGSGIFKMKGEIVAGDFVKFKNALALEDTPPNSFMITSLGGNLKEAMLIGNFIRKSQIPIWASVECSSACFFIYVAGVERKSLTEIGLHRPYFDKKHYLNLTASDAQKQYIVLESVARDYLKEMGVKQKMIDRLFSTSSTDIDYLSALEIKISLGQFSPFYEEWLISKCEALTEQEVKIKSSISSLDWFEDISKYRNENPNTDHPNYSFDNLVAMKEGAKLAMYLERIGKLGMYKEIINLKSSCLSLANYEHVQEFYETFQKQWLLSSTNSKALENKRNERREKYQQYLEFLDKR